MSVTIPDLWRTSATDLAEAIRSRQTSSHEVIEAHLRRIEEVNPSVNAVTLVLVCGSNRSPRRPPSGRRGVALP